MPVSGRLVSLLATCLLAFELAQAPRLCAGAAQASPEAFLAEQVYDAAVDKVRTHQHVWKRRATPYKVLFLTTFLDYTIQMDRYYYDLVESAARHPDTRIVVWGPGFPEWKENLTVGENVYEKYDCDFSFLYFHNGNRGLQVGPRSNIEPCLERMTIIEEMHDCHKYWCKNGIYETGLASDIVIARYGFIPLELFSKNDPTSPTFRADSPVKLLAHNPDCADPRKVQPKYFHQKTQKAVLIGSTDPSLYPLRAKILVGIVKKEIKSIERIRHPGYFVNASTVPVQEYSEQSQITKNALAQYSTYVDTISSAYICVFDSSVVKKTIKKFMESMLAGCVVASDVPMDMLGAMHDLIVPLDASMPFAQLDGTVQERLDNRSNLQDLAARGIHYALHHFTCEAKFERLLDIYDSFMSGFHGYHFPYGFRAGCGHHYQGNRNPNWWCKNAPHPTRKRLSFR